MHGERLGASYRGAERTAQGSPVRGSIALESSSPGEPYPGEHFPGFPSPVPGRSRIAAGVEKGCTRATARSSGMGEQREEQSPVTLPPAAVLAPSRTALPAPACSERFHYSSTFRSPKKAGRPTHPLS